MNRVKQAFECARDRGDGYFLVMQKKEGKEIEPLTLILSGGRGEIYMLANEFGTGGPYTGGGHGFAQYGIFSLEQPWEDAEEALRVLDFKM